MAFYALAYPPDILCVVAVVVTGDGLRTASSATACQCRLQGFFAAWRGRVAVAGDDANVDTGELICSAKRRLDGRIDDAEQQQRRSSSGRQSSVSVVVGGCSQRTVQVLSASFLVLRFASLLVSVPRLMLHTASSMLPVFASTYFVCVCRSR
uniref:Secreted protein n=1 Tax=Plectus sambesii TaxID=2011161 RepID=A0A914W7M0_9BILA